MKKITLLLLLAFSANIIGQNQTYTIDDPESLRDVIYQPGDVIILKNGTYSTDERMRFLGSGTAENPVTFRAETPGGVIFTGGPRLTIGGETEDGVQIATGEYLIVDGLYWKGGYGASNFIEFRNGSDYAHHSTIQNCVIDGLGVEQSELDEDLADEQITKHRWVVLYGTYNTVINCSFMNKVTSGAIVLGEYAYNAFPDEDDESINTSCNEVGHKIMNNYFFNYEKITELYPFTKSNGDPYSNAGDSETIRIGTSSYQMVNSNAVVSNNYFVQADGENEIITNKSKGNTYTNNTFRRCRGSLVLRHGSYATVDGNYFLGENVDGTGGIRIVDSKHTITNNYIQDCITVESQAKWNNGITFLGGSANADVDCTTDDVSSDYQKVEDITLSNNSIVNTNAPFFYNEDKGSTDPKGTVENNLIYFDANNQNLSNVISGDSDSAFSNLGTALDYSSNVFTGTSLGATTTGFTEETGITATANGEIFTFTGADGKGANMGSYTPITDDMVGYSIGACFIDNAGNPITDGDCTIEVVESIAVSTLSSLTQDAGSYDVTVTANVEWTAVSNDNWITIDTNSGTGNTTISVTVTENTSSSARTGSVTFTQVAGGDDIVRNLTVTQDGASLVDLYTLINDGGSNDAVIVHSFSKEEVDGSSKFNYATNTLDKDMNSVWAADDGSILANDYKGDGEYIIYDLGQTYNLGLIQFGTTSKADAFGYQIWVSTTGTDSANFSKVLPENDDLLLTKTNTTDFNQYELSANARYVKLIGFGRFNTEGTERESVWSAVSEIEFFSESALSTSSENLNFLSIYPNPAFDKIFVTNPNNTLSSFEIFSLNGRKVLGNNSNILKSNIEINVSGLSKGIYILKLNSNNSSISKKIILK
ncbi:T9SS type A sorting domain-containing protein [Polaribacter sp.]|nr:T9SS type A sorting domain-containing protein [Polaribacter sp.]